MLAKTLAGSGKTQIKLKEHKGLDAPRDDKGRVPTDSLGDWFESQASEIAKQYDDRAGTSQWRDELQKNLARVGQLKPIA